MRDVCEGTQSRDAGVRISQAAARGLVHIPRLTMAYRRRLTASALLQLTAAPDASRRVSLSVPKANYVIAHVDNYRISGPTPFMDRERLSRSVHMAAALM